MLGSDNSIVFADLPAETWLADLAGDRRADPLPPVVAAVAARAGASRPATRRSGDRAGRVRAVSGQWLIVRGTTLGEVTDGQTAVMIEPARSHELAPLAAEAYELTERERAVTELVAEGLATGAIADRLYISAWTVQDHLKSIFEKVGVRTRGEMIARVFFGANVPTLSEPRGARQDARGSSESAGPDGRTSATSGARISVSRLL